ncbi:MAG: DUF1844 domain-containing protein [Candidatus Acidiferrales bacterium]
MADPKPEETFKVIDRRHFTESGDLRQDVVEQEKRDEEAAAKRAATAPQPKPHAKSPAQKQAVDEAPAQKHGNEDVVPAADGELSATHEADGSTESSRSFQMLVDFLTRNAAAMLGGMADPRTGQPFVDLEGAREVIDMLDALREKTRGNLSKADDDLLIEVLGSLKLTFMEISKAATEAMAKKAGKKG